MPGAGQAIGAVVALAAITLVWEAAAQTGAADGQAPQTPCVVTGDPSVRINGRPMLRLGDVIGCPDLRYDIIPNVMIGGQPAVRLSANGACSAGGSVNVTINGAPAATAGDVACQ